MLSHEMHEKFISRFKCNTIQQRERITDIHIDVHIVKIISCASDQLASISISLRSFYRFYEFQRGFQKDIEMTVNREKLSRGNVSKWSRKIGIPSPKHFLVSPRRFY